MPAGQAVQVTWYASSSEHTVVSQLFYDKDGVKDSGDEVLLTQLSKVANDYTVCDFSWDTSSMTPGTYNLLLVADDSTNPIVTIYNSYTVTIVASTPKIDVTEPTAPVTVTPAMNVVIKWTQYAPLADSTVTLYYDDDINRANGYKAKIATFNKKATDTSGSYIWNVPAIAAGQYYILAELNYGSGTIYSYSAAPVTVNSAGIEVYSPAAAITWHSGGSLAIRYQVDGADSGTTAKLFYQDASGAKTVLVTQPVTSSQAQSWTWISDPLPAGIYTVGVTVDDGVNDPALMTAYAPGSVTDAGPTFSITSDLPAAFHAGDVLPVTFSYQMFTGNATVKFYLDTDTDKTNGWVEPAIGQTTVDSTR